jgi:hypothetical protein
LLVGAFLRELDWSFPCVVSDITHKRAAHTRRQGAIAAKPSATYKGYLLGGLCWFAIPFTMVREAGAHTRLGASCVTRNEGERSPPPPRSQTARPCEAQHTHTPDPS